MEPTRVAVIGCGSIARSGHLPAYRAAAERGLCTLVGVCDVDRGRAEAMGTAHGVPAFDSAAELLDRTRPESVSITTYPNNHRQLTLLALEAGCHVLCEKPVALNAAEAEDMVRAAERHGRLLSICFEYRCWDESVYLRDRIAAGDLGHVHLVRTWGGASDIFLGNSTHRSRSLSGGGVLNHWTVHNLDLALWLLGNPEPLAASAFGHQRLRHVPEAAFTSGRTRHRPSEVDPAIEDFGVAFIRLAGGTILTVEANFLGPPSTRPEGWEILGDLGAASISPIQVWLDRGDRWADDTPPAGTLAPCDYDMTRLIVGFLDRVRSGGPAPVSGPEIVRIQRLMDAIYRSIDEGREVPVT